jgi:hypothetical protein
MQDKAATVNNIQEAAQAPSALSQVQERFSLLNISAEIRIIDNQEVASVLAGKKNDISLYKRPEGQLVMKRYIETLPIATKPKEVIDQFLVHPKTHTYDEIAFSPLKTPSTTLNYWRGPTVTPAPGDWSVIRDFLYEVICDGDLALYHYLLRYIAHMLQHPEEKPSIAIVMLSRSGCGKGTFFQLLTNIWSKSAIEVSDINHVIGSFNAALEKNYVVMMDEAIFVGNKAAMERLKNMISEPTVRVEQKYQPSRTIESYHRFFAASNSEHFASIPIDDRRFVFIKVSARKQQDLIYFDMVHKAINDSVTIAAFVYDLFAMDLTHFQVRQRPITSEHLNQRIQSLDGFERYWLEVLETGKFRTKPMGIYSSSDTSWEDSIFISTQTIIDSYSHYDKNANRYEPLQTQKVAATLQKICPSAKSDRITNTSGKQERGYQLPVISVARIEFESAIKTQICWNNQTQENTEPDYEEEFDHDLLYDAMRENASETI